MTIPSPCQNICVLDENQVCIGCRRTLEEVALWGRFDDDRKKAVIDRIAAEEAREAESPGAVS